MNNLVAQRQGQPVLFLGLLVAGWFLLRLLTWENPWVDPAILSEPFLLVGEQIGATQLQTEHADASAREVPPARVVGHDHRGSLTLRRLSGPEGNALQSSSVGPPISKAPDTVFLRIDSARHAGFAADRKLDDHDRSAAAGLAPPTAQPSAQLSDWRIDAWLVLREGVPGSADGGPLPASYGASQAGAVLSYRLASTNPHRPAAYFRATRSIGTDAQTDGAVGLRARPLENVPIDIHLEARVTHRPGSTEIRPAAFVAGGFDRVELPMELQARGYGQAGYVGGDFETSFADGAVVAEREAVRFGAGSLSLGAGMWGGAQTGASRFDLGPTMTLDVTSGEIPIRLEAAYRLRAAGDAAPGDGGVLTLSTGF